MRGSWAIPARDDMVEFAGSRQKETLRPGFDIDSWIESDLRERMVGDRHEEKEISFELGAHEIRTVLLEA